MQKARIEVVGVDKEEINTNKEKALDLKIDLIHKVNPGSSCG